MTTAHPILDPCNPEGGFFGAFANRARAVLAWGFAMQKLHAATGFSPEAIRDFLDSARGFRLGRRIERAARGAGLEAAIDEAVCEAMARTTDGAREKRDGTLAGTPALVAEIARYEFECEGAE